MFDLIISRQGITRDFTTLGPTCVTAPPVQLGLSEPQLKIAHSQNHKETKQTLVVILNVTQKKLKLKFLYQFPTH